MTPGATVPVAGKLVPSRPDIASGQFDIDRKGLPAGDPQGGKGRHLGLSEGRPGRIGGLGDGSMAGFGRDGLIGAFVPSGRYAIWRVTAA